MKLPILTIEATGCVERGTEYLGLCMQISNLAVSQYVNYNFDSMCEYDGKYLAVGPDGLYQIRTGNLDGALEIEAQVELHKTDFGVQYQKRLRSVYLGYETDGSLKLTLLNDGKNERVYELASSDEFQHGGKIAINRDGKGRYWVFNIQNLRGCDFSLDSIIVIPVILQAKSQ